LDATLTFPLVLDATFVCPLVFHAPFIFPLILDATFIFGRSPGGHYLMQLEAHGLLALLVLRPGLLEDSVQVFLGVDHHDLPSLVLLLARRLFLLGLGDCGNRGILLDVLLLLDEVC
jgi:hypothetical protein